MPSTYKLISSVSIPSGSTQSTLDFTSIPQNYQNLEIWLSVHSPSSLGTDTIGLRFNGVSTSTYYSNRVQGYGQYGQSATSVGADTRTQVGLIDDNANSANNYFTFTKIFIPNYSGTQRKDFISDSVSEYNDQYKLIRLSRNIWDGTNAITSISMSIFSAGYSFGGYTNAYLYGIANS